MFDFARPSAGFFGVYFFQALSLIMRELCNYELGMRVVQRMRVCVCVWAIFNFEILAANK